MLLQELTTQECTSRGIRITNAVLCWMEEEETIRGLWFIHGENRQPLPGSLEVKGGKIQLLFWVSQNANINDVVASASAESAFDIPNIIQGSDQYNHPITLFGCSVSNRSVSVGVDSWEVDVLAAVKGIAVPSWSSAFIHAVKISPSFLHRWFGTRLIKEAARIDAATVLTLGESIDIEHLVEPGVRLRLVENIGCSSSLDESVVKPESVVWFQFEQQKSLHELLERWIPWITQLLSLFTETAVRAMKIDVFRADPYEPGQHTLENFGVLILSAGTTNNRREQTHPSFHVLVPFDLVRDQLGTIVQQWHRVREQLQPVVSLFSAVAFHYPLYAEARFLFLVQALEIYFTHCSRFETLELSREEHAHRMAEAREALPESLMGWAEGKLRMNFRPLSQKLLDLFAAHNSECLQLFGDLNRAASRISYTRNHLTHHYEDANRNRLMNSQEISETNFKLEALLWLILLREMGIDGEPVRHIVQKAADVQFIQLAG